MKNEQNLAEQRDALASLFLCLASSPFYRGMVVKDALANMAKNGILSPALLAILGQMADRVVGMPREETES